MANRWGNNGNCDRLFIFLDSKIPVGGDCSHEIKRHLFLGRKAMTNLDSVLASRDITLPTKVHLVKTVVFPLVMYRCESWTIRKAEHQRIGFWIVVLEKILESPLDNKEIKPVNPKGNQLWKLIGRTYSEAKSPILWTPDEKSWLIRKDSVLAMIEGRKRRGWQRMRWLDGITDSMNMSLRKLWEMVKDRDNWCTTLHGWQRVRHDWATEWQQNPLDYIVHGILQVRRLEWVGVSFSRGSNQGSNPGLHHYGWIFYQLNHKGNPN